MDLSGAEYGPVVGCCEYVYELMEEKRGIS
jgi:hypothetical protein